MLEIIGTCVLLYAGEKIEVESPGNVSAVEAYTEGQSGVFYMPFYPSVQAPLLRVRVTMKRLVNVGEAVALPKACRSEVEVKKP